MTSETNDGTRNSRAASGFARVAQLAVLALIGSALGGCAAIPLATIGTVAGITSSAVSTGRTVFTLGKLDTAEMAGYPETLEAARAAATDLYLKPKGPDQLKDWSGTLTFVDEKDGKVEVTVERRTEMMVRLRIDMGLFGSQVTAELFLTRLRLHLPPVKPPQPQTPASTEPAPA
jgi:hypothetical protein